MHDKRVGCYHSMGRANKLIGNCNCKSLQYANGKPGDTLQLKWRWKYILNGYGVQDDGWFGNDTIQSTFTSIRVLNPKTRKWHVPFFTPNMIQNPNIWIGGKEGENIRVMVMANVDQIKLLLNGVELAEQKVNAYKMNYFNVPFQEGKLEAIGFNNEIEVARATVETTGKAVSLELTPDRNSLVGDGRDAMPITVRALDNKGRAVPIDNSTVTFTVNGAGKSIGHGNGDPTSHENEKGNSRQLFNGLAQLIVQSNYESKGEINITANAKGLKSTRISIPVHETPPVPYVAKADAPLNFLTNWRVSPATKFRPDPMQILADNDMNTWGWGQPPMFRTPEENTGANYRLYRTYFTPRKTLADGTGSIHFYGIVGKAEVWLDGKLLTKKDEFALTELNIPLPSGTNKRQVNVIIQGEGNKKAGVFGDVVIEPKK